MATPMLLTTPPFVARTASGFAGGTATGAIFGTGFELTPSALTVISLMMGFATAVTVAIIGARAQKANQARDSDDLLEHWVVERMAALEADKERLEAELWEARRRNDGGPPTATG